MSDIPRAKRVIDKLLVAAEMPTFVRHSLEYARNLLDREPPTFMTEAKLPPLTRDQVQQVKRLRGIRMPMNDIARMLGTNIGRVSEAINGKREGI